MPNETMVHVQEGLFLMWPGKIADREKIRRRKWCKWLLGQIKAFKGVFDSHINKLVPGVPMSFIRARIFYFFAIGVEKALEKFFFCSNSYLAGYLTNSKYNTNQKVFTLLKSSKKSY